MINATTAAPISSHRGTSDGAVLEQDQLGWSMRAHDRSETRWSDEARSARQFQNTTAPTIAATKTRPERRATVKAGFGGRSALRGRGSVGRYPLAPLSPLGPSCRAVVKRPRRAWSVWCERARSTVPYPLVLAISIVCTPSTESPISSTAVTELRGSRRSVSVSCSTMIRAVRSTLTATERQSRSTQRYAPPVISFSLLGSRLITSTLPRVECRVPSLGPCEPNTLRASNN